MKVSKRAVLAVVAAALSGCGVFDDPPRTGVVVDKQVEKETKYRGTGSSRRSYTDTEYKLSIRGDDGKTGVVEVPLGEYDRCEVNERWPDCRNG
jgi:hypothetical protein